MKPYQPPRTALGEREPFLLRINDTLLNTVAFLGEDEAKPGGARRVIPSASAFFVRVDEGKHHFVYVVTARHCIEETAGRDFYVRINTEQGVVDERTNADKWFEHYDADVAATIWAPQAQHRFSAVGLDGFMSADYDFDPLSYMGPPGGVPLSGQRPETPTYKVMTGDTVTFIGLFVQAPGSERNLPVARFGHVSRMPQEPITFERSDGTRFKGIAYLAESHSWGGHSGSPVFWHAEQFRIKPVPLTPQGPSVPVALPMHDMVVLLGLVSGHFDIPQEAELRGDILGSVTQSLNAGMAIVTPAEAIRELLMREDVVNDRKKRIANAPDEPAATLDSAHVVRAVSDEPDEFERFEDLTRQLVNTPKENPEGE